MSAEATYREAVAALEAAQRKLGATPRSDVESRVAATHAVDVATAAVREAKEAVKRENARRNFAGVGSPLHSACLERLDPVVVMALEERAMSIQHERELRAAERRAEKAAAPKLAPPPPLRSDGPEVVHVVAGQSARART